eukprot:6035566-Pleurochrysis_carterae.AAC.1
MCSNIRSKSHIQIRTLPYVHAHARTHAHSHTSAQTHAHASTRTHARTRTCVASANRVDLAVEGTGSKRLSLSRQIGNLAPNGCSHIVTFD